ncbi:MAG: histidinol dehydrogenase [bacterium]|nr:histidinol dehydrogenase [bacterium]
MSDPAPFLRTRKLSELDDPALQDLIRRNPITDPEVRQAAAAICRKIALGGDQALAEASLSYGGGRQNPRIGRREIESALQATKSDTREALERAIEAVGSYHQTQSPTPICHETSPGVRIERIWTPLQRVGAYVPGGKAAYPSTLVMTVVPARIAGVAEMVVVTPGDENGRIDSTLLAAAGLLEVDEIYVIGGAQAIATLAYGTETIPPVDKIVGPGNAWVTAAKLEVFGTCGVDLPAGPSEALVIADHTARPELVAIDLLCQTEHGPDSPALLVTTDPGLASEVEAVIAGLLEILPRREILRTALSEHGEILIVDSLDEAVGFANQYAPEHASVMTEHAEETAAEVVNAGSVYVGPWSPESAGDYATGANHVLPTGGLARSNSPLGVEDFGSWRQVQTLTEDGLAHLRPVIEDLAAAEGLDAHRMAASMRFDPPSFKPPTTNNLEV